MNQTEIELRARTADYVLGRISLQQYNHWLAPFAWDLQESTDPARDLAMSLELRLAEFSGGSWTEQELKRELGLIAATSSAVTELTLGSLASPRSRLLTAHAARTEQVAVCL
jgi:hypothetical protein